VELAVRAVAWPGRAGKDRAEGGAGARAARIAKGPPMKLATISLAGRDRVCAVTADGALVDLAQALAEARGDAPAWAADMIALIAAGPEALAAARAALAFAEAHPDRVPPLPAAGVAWLPPVLRPSKLCCLALNNSANADRILSGPGHPAVFTKAANALVGHEGDIRLRPEFGRVHPEPELAVVIGRTASDVTAAAAMEHVFGYTVHNDITSPTMRGEDTFHYRAIHPGADGTGLRHVETHVTYPGRYKGADTFSPLGPWIVTRDEIADPHALAVTCRHRGEIVTEDSTANLTHRIPEVIAFVSSYMTLLPGDVLSMGTALKRAGAGTGRAVQTVDLATLGGPVSVTIQNIGTLSSNVRMLTQRNATP
jgi:2-keto-4-pentenoate hydratase/2-oxohepta-3-ene-1,7-dioic acid hydratase in catechol pathway